MKCQVSHGIACLPVTALHTIDLGHTTLLLSNEGSTLCARYSHDGKVIGRWPVFGSQTIHGITSCVHCRDDGAVEYILAIWGGRMLRICSIVTQNPGAQGSEDNITLRSRPTIGIIDWIMTVTINEKSLDALILTAHNALWSLKLAHDTTHVVKSPPTLVGQGMKTLLYSACITVISDERVLIASGTVFGEVIVWLCLRSTGQWDTFRRHILLGHQGSIFGVAVSDIIFAPAGTYRLLASCSDDRTIRIWDISDCDSVTSGLQEGELLSTNTGFGSRDDQNLHLAMAWAHTSRIWGVCFTPFSTDLNVVSRLVSRGEDGVCQFWDLRLGGQGRGVKSLEIALEPIRSDRHHSGKNAWSLSIDSQLDMAKVFTGGADGQIVSRYLPSKKSTTAGFMQFTEVVRVTNESSARALRHYVVFMNGIILTTTNYGHLLQSRIDTPKEWKVVHSPGKVSTTTLCSNVAKRFTFYCLDTGELCVYDTGNDSPSSTVAILPSQATWLQIAYHEEHNTDTYTVYLMATLYKDRGSTLIVVEKTNAGFELRMLQSNLPTDFDVTSSLYCRQYDVLICGSRAGALAIIPNVQSTSGQLVEGLVIRHIHGSDAVTSIIVLPEQENVTMAESLHLLTTGRDGIFVVLQVRVEGSHISCTTLHRATPPFGPYVEGACVIAHEDQKPKLVMYGFKSRDFIVWDETNQLRLLSVECGGAHRNWGYSNTDNGPGLFVWTKAGTFNFHQSTQQSAESLQQGSHGREIKAAAMTIGQGCDDSADSHQDTVGLLATGAEDTEIRLSKYTSKSLTSIAVLKQHMTGIQALQFSPCGNYLFSSGGAEEFFVWKLNQVPLLDIGAVVVGVLEKTNEDDDARIMNFSVVRQDPDGSQSATFVVLTACSNGKAKVFEFRHPESAKLGHFKLLQVLNIGALCLTQAHLLEEEQSLSMLVGSTDGFLRFAEMDVAKEAIVSHRVHQSSIAAMAVRKLQVRTYLIATGGDDNGLGVSLLRTDTESHTFGTVLIPKAHSAALTAIAFVKRGRHNIAGNTFIVSAGNDQQVRLWCISGLDLDRVDASDNSTGLVPEPLLSTVEVNEVCRYPTDVADVSSIEVVERDADSGVHRFEVLVAGVGIQSINFEIAI